MCDIFILLNVHFIVLDQNNGALIVIFTAIIWSAEYCNHRRKGLVASPAVHLVAINLDLMGTNDRDEIVRSKDFLNRIQPEFDRTLSLNILTEAQFSRVLVIHWV